MIPFILANWRALGFVIVAVGIFYAGYHVRWALDEAGKAKALQEQQEVFAKQIEDANTKGAELEKELARQKSSVRMLNRRIQDDISANSIYRTCKPTADGLRSLNATIAARLPPAKRPQ